MIVNQCPEHTFKARIESIGPALVKYRSNTGQKPAKHWSGSCWQNTALVLRGSPEGSLVKTLVINRSCWSNTGHAGQTPVQRNTVLRGSMAVVVFKTQGEVWSKPLVKTQVGV
jgi:hypothetical protein